MDWARAVDIDRALGNIHVELLGDWFRDPWGWPELDWVAKTQKGMVFSRLNAEGARMACTVDVPKENYMIRPAIVMDPVDRLAYQALVDQLSKKLIGHLSPQAFGWRLPAKNPESGKYSPNNMQWNLYRKHLGLLAANYDVALKTDVVSCFSSIQLEVVVDAVVARAGSSQIVNRLISLIEGWEKIPNRSGIPQRSLASSVIANLVLSHIDDILGYYARPVPDTDAASSYARWMDDMWLFGEDAGHLRRAQVELQDALRSLGLHMNSGKTQLLEGPEIATQALDVEHSAVDNALHLLDLGMKTEATPFGVRKSDATILLDELIEKLVEKKEGASRTSVRFATKRMRDYNHYQKIDDLIDIAARMPHCADSLARLFRDAGRAAELSDWYLEYRVSPWAKMEWASAQFGTMFSSRTLPGHALIDHFSELLATGGTSLPMTAVLAQRLASWDSAKARAVIPEAIKHTDHPLQRRVLALAAVHAGYHRPTVRKWLGDFEENAVTLQMLTETHFKRLKLKEDFEA